MTFDLSRISDAHKSYFVLNILAYLSLSRVSFYLAGWLVGCKKERYKHTSHGVGELYAHDHHENKTLKVVGEMSKP